MKFETEPTQLEIETSARLWAASEILARDLNHHVALEMVRAFFKGEDMNSTFAAYCGEGLHGLATKNPRIISETLSEIRL